MATGSVEDPLTKLNASSMAASKMDYSRLSKPEFSCNEVLTKGEFQGCTGYRSSNYAPVDTYRRKTTVACDSGGNTLNPMSFKYRMLSSLQAVRAPLADYQENRGLSKHESYTFWNLITSLCQHAYEAGLTIMTMLINLLPLLEGFLYFVRFVLDRLIDICQSDNNVEMALKGTLLFGQLLLIVFLILTITSFIIVPVWTMLRYLIGKTWGLLHVARFIFSIQ